LDEINIGPKRDFRLPSPRWFVVAATAGLIAAAATLIATTGGGRHVPQIPTAAPGTVLLTCESANWGRLPPNWRALSLRAGPLWFVGDRLFGYVHGYSSQGARRTIARYGRLRDRVMIVEVTDGSTAVMKAAAVARPYFRFLDGFGSNHGNPLPGGDVGFTFSSCPRGHRGPNGPVTDCSLGFSIEAGRMVPVEVRTSSSTRPIRLTFTSLRRGALSNM